MKSIIVISALLFTLFTLSCISSSSRAIAVAGRHNYDRFETVLYGSDYSNSTLIVIGINSYRHVAPLRQAVSDGRAIEKLFASQGFKTISIYDSEATKERIEYVLKSEFQNAGPNDRILVFYAGHGMDIKHPDGGTTGYLIPVNGRDDDISRLVSLDWLQIDLVSKKSTMAKHILYILDACSSGIVASRSFVRVDSSLRNYMSELMKRQARQVITAGTGDQQVLDGGYKGHSIFTGYILQGIENNLADINNDFYITATELGLFLSQQVYMSSRGAQKPDFAKLAGTQGGEVVLKFPNREEKLALEERRKGIKVENVELALNITPTQSIVSIYDMDDKLILRKKTVDGSLSVSNIPSGDYTVCISPTDKRYARIKLIVGLYGKVTRHVMLTRIYKKMSFSPIL